MLYTVQTHTHVHTHTGVVMAYAQLTPDLTIPNLRIIINLIMILTMTSFFASQKFPTLTTLGNGQKSNNEQVRSKFFYKS